MNAPWKVSGHHTTRDAFAAFICDDASLNVLRPVVGELGWAPEKCNKGGLRNAVQSLSITSSPNILMVDLSESGDPLADINALAEVCEPGTVVIAVGQDAVSGEPTGFTVVMLSRVLATYYFAYFLLVLPLLGLFEKTLAVPDTISTPVLPKGGASMPTGATASPEKKG